MGFRLAPKSMTLDDLKLNGGRPPLLPREATRSAALPRQFVRLSVRLDVTLRHRDHIVWIS